MEQRTNEITISIAQLPIGLHKYHFLPEASAIGLENNFQKPVRIDAALERSAQQLYVKTEVQAPGLFRCDRCIEEFEHEITTTFVLVYVYNELDAAQFTEDDVRIIDINTPALDITEDVREMVMLAIPLKLLCKENCQGLCPHCGVNHNYQTCKCKDEEVDSRWDGLKKLLKN